MRAPLLACVIAALALAAAADAAPAPTAHDRALAAQLNAKVSTFRSISSNTAPADNPLEKCAVFHGDPKQALGALFVMIPVFLTQIVDEYGPQIRQLRETLRTMKPDSPLFRRWLAAEEGNISLLLQFDNHGKKVDLCTAVKVLLDKTSTDADVYRVTGIHIALIGRLFGSSQSQTLTKLNPQMRAFFLAAGISGADADALTSN
jgi:hypothetical protein